MKGKFQWYFALRASNLAKNLVVRHKDGSLGGLRSDRHEVGENNDSFTAMEGRAQDIRIWLVLARDTEYVFGGRRYSPTSATLTIENRGKDGRTVEAGPTKPVE